MKKFFALLLALVMVLSLAACGGNSSNTTPDTNTNTNTDTNTENTDSNTENTTPDTVYTIKFTYTIADGEPITECVHKLGENLEAKSGGRIKCEYYPSAELATDAGGFELCAQGSNVIAFALPSYLTPYVEDVGVVERPFIFNSKDDLITVDTSDWMEGIRAKLSEQGIRNLSLSWYFGTRHLTYTGDTPVLTPADLSNKLMRAAPTATSVKMMEAMGAKVTTTPWSEIYSALQQGVADGCEAPLSTLYNSKTQEVCKNISLDGHTIASWGVCTSEKFFQSLPEDLQQLLIDETRALAPMAAELVSQGEQDAIKLFEDAGVKIYDNVDVDAFREACAIFDDSIPGWGEAVYNEIQAIISK